MTDASHPFSDDRIAEVADECGTDETDLESALAEVQDALSRQNSDEEYEYSSQHNFAWEDGDAYYLYGDGVWATLAAERSLSEAVADAAREVHRREMLASADDRGERESVAEMFDEGTEPLVVRSTASEPPLFGQDV